MPQSSAFFSFHFLLFCFSISPKTNSLAEMNFCFRPHYRQGSVLSRQTQRQSERQAETTISLKPPESMPACLPIKVMKDKRMTNGNKNRTHDVRKRSTERR
mmetsp:Transcript_29805/g.58491  ORF Transcript_29805/g.58491 Transcript_29805/m.58491 type:complete len:101 (+) Transcript_29805:1936-2238(+)